MYLDDDIDKSGFKSPPPDLTISYTGDCKTTTAVLARDETGTAGYNVTVTGPDGAGIGNSVARTPAAVTVGFASAADGVYLLQPIDTAGTFYPVIPVLVVCRLLKCRRELNKRPATNGLAKRGKAPDEKLLALDGLLRMAYACYYQGDLVSAAALLKKATELCTDCGCGCAEC